MNRRRIALGICLAMLTFVWGQAGCGGGDKPKAKPTPTPAKTDEGTPATTKPSSEGAKESAGGAPAVEGWGTIKGQIVWGGDIPETEILFKQGDQNAKDAAVCAVHDIVKEEVVADKESKGLRWVVVSIFGKPKIHPDIAKPEGTAELGQEFCHFIPHVLAMRQGQKFIVSSNDPIAHNTNCQGVKNGGFNPVVPAAKVDEKSTLDGPDFVADRIKVNCNIHTWMSAWVVVFDHPYFAVTDRDGNFDIKNVPAGAQKLVIWHEKGFSEGNGKGNDITVKADGTTDLGKITYILPK